jgi:hypothetical protein
MDKSALALQMKRTTIWLDRCCQPEGLVRQQFAAPPFGGCYLTIDPDRQGLGHSYRNLRRAGFEEAYEKEVYEWNAQGT